MGKLAALAVAGLLSAAISQTATASINYATAGSTYTQDFNSLPTTPTNATIQTGSFTGWKDDSTTTATNVSIPGWYLYHPLASSTEGGSNQHQRLRAGTGSSTTGAFYSFGASGNTDRALGMLPSAALAGDGDSMRIGLRLTNTTGAPIGSFTVMYDGEQYRDDASSGAISFSYARNVDETNWFNAGANAIFVNAATFNPPVTANSPASTVNGNTTGLVADITATVTFPDDSPWMPGTDLFLRWSQIQVASLADDGLAIDNVRFTAQAVAPEPASLSLLVLAAAPLFGRRRGR